MRESDESEVAWALVGLGFAVAGIAIRCVALADAWAWFVVPLGVHAISPLHAYGLVLVAMLVKGQHEAKQDPDLAKKTARQLAWHALSHSVGGALVAWGIAWCVAQAVAQ